MIERPDKLNNQAILLAADGDFAGAIACFKRAILIEKQNQLLWYNLGLTYRDSGDLKNARSCLTKAHQIAPENEETLGALTELMLRMNLFSQAEEYALEGLNTNECNSNFWNLLGVACFKQEQYKEAAEHFETALTINPYFEDALFNLKDTYLELGNKIGADECEKRLKQIN